MKHFSSRGRYLRNGRHSEFRRPYHVVVCTSGRQPLFHDFSLGRIVIRSLRWHDQRGRTSTFAFVVMPDHIHWLFELQSAVPLSQLVMTMKSFTAREINETLGCAGQAVWQRGYFDHAVRREEDLRQIARYIVTNPLRAGIVANVGDYPLWDACWL